MDKPGKKKGGVLLLFALVLFSFVPGTVAGAKTDAMPPYEVVRTKNDAEGKENRLSLRVVVPKGTSRDVIPALARKIIEETRARRPANAIEILFYDDKADIEGPFTVAGVQWAPFGDPGRAGEVAAGDDSRNEMNLIFASPPEDEGPAPEAAVQPRETADDEIPEGVEDDAGQKEIRRLVEDWRSTWEKKDLDGYLSFYSPHARFQNMDIAGFRNKKKGIFEQPGAIRITLSDFHAEVAAGTAVATFLQRYESNQLTDWGKKTLYWVSTDDGWKIVREDWEAATAPLPEQKSLPQDSTRSEGQDSAKRASSP